MLLDNEQGYMENLPEPTIGLQKELDASKQHVAELKEQLERVTGVLEEAQGQLQQRVENQRLLDAAKATKSELEVSSTDG